MRSAVMAMTSSPSYTIMTSGCYAKAGVHLFVDLRCWRHRSRHSPSTSSSVIKSDKGRSGGGSLSCRGILISRRKSSRNRRKVFSSAIEPAIISHSWTDSDNSSRQCTNFSGLRRRRRRRKRRGVGTLSRARADYLNECELPGARGVPVRVTERERASRYQGFRMITRM
ncbi:hypothetical protein KUCAC02_002910 [Chaenocephalus aceratus]|uniref:Uncharacterized protein n=1 Tax=Chaenocephalus aceratus TaxID=36190 RepID=A0ACB9WJP1_CHAAC|nr:hypothetical protein KUCAC02_002910 [Chaenocephalus aceratus]